MTPLVSIIILNYNHVEVIEKCLRTLAITEGVDYEVVVVDNGSTPDVKATLEQFKQEGLIDVLVSERINHMFSEGNNIGVRSGNQQSEYVLFLNSDVAFLRPDWLSQMLAWMDGVPSTARPSIWDFHPTRPSPGPRDIVSIGWSHDASVTSQCRPEGWCCMIRRRFYVEMSSDFPWLYGFEESMSKSIRAGAKCGVLSQYGSYLVHREGGSEASKLQAMILNKREPRLDEWLGGLDIESLDFTLGPNEHDSYLVW